MAVISRLKVDHPALGTAGGSALHASVEAIYKKIGDNMADRFFYIQNLAAAGTLDCEHNYNAPLSSLRYDVYSWNEVSGELTLLTSATTPARSSIGIAAKVGSELTHVVVTNSSGAERDLVLVMHHDPIEMMGNDLSDVDNSTAIEEGQTYVYDSASGKMKPGASGDSSFKVQSVSTPNAVIKGGQLLLGDGRELATYDGAGTASTDFGKDLTVNLTTILGASPADATAYFLYVDLQSLSSVVTLSDNGRKVYAVQEANLHLSTTAPESKDPRRYVPVGFIRSADTGTAWSGTGSKFGTLAFRRHDTLTRFFSYPEKYETAITSAAASNLLTHNLSAKADVVELTYWDGAKEVGLDNSAHLVDNGATQLNISSMGLTFGGGQELRVKAVKFPAQSAIAASSRQFKSGWYDSTATTTVAHGLNDMEDILGYEVQEWNTSTGRIRNIDKSALVKEFDATNFYLDWTGLTPSATLKYRVVAGGSPLPFSVPVQYGGFTKIVGAGQGSYATLSAAIAASAPGDSILVNRDTTEPAGDLNINVADLRIAFMPNAVCKLSGALTNGLRLSAARILVERGRFKFEPSGAQARGFSVEAADCSMDNCELELNTAQTLTDAVHITSGGSRAYVQARLKATLGTITNGVTNNDGASSVNAWGA